MTSVDDCFVWCFGCYIVCITCMYLYKLYVCIFVVGEMQSLAAFCKYSRLSISSDLLTETHSTLVVAYLVWPMGWRPNVADWGHSISASCTEASAQALNDHIIPCTVIALISCHFWDCEMMLVMNLLHLSSTIANL